MSNTTIPLKVKQDLWFAAHGRCEFTGCNKPLYVHGVTMNGCNISNYAHIIGDSENGPRGDKALSRKLAQDPSNLILLCPECHRLIDQEGKDKFTVEILRNMKKEHEERIERVTGIQPDKKSLVVIYGPKIGSDTPHFHKDTLYNTIFPEKYPSATSPVEIQMNNSVMQDGDSDYWAAEIKQIESICEERILKPLKEHEVSDVSLFALGPQPLLVKLGTVLNDKYPIHIYQKHHSLDSWKWFDEEESNNICVVEPEDKSKDPVLVIALSANAIKERINKRYGDEASVWCITCANPGNDMLRSKEQLKQFGKVARQAMDDIKTHHPDATPLKIFMAAPSACAVELGRIRMQKADLFWTLYDYNLEKGEDFETITIK